MKLYRILEYSGCYFTPQWRYSWFPFWLDVYTPMKRRVHRVSYPCAKNALELYILPNLKEETLLENIKIHNLTEKEIRG